MAWAYDRQRPPVSGALADIIQQGINTAPLGEEEDTSWAKGPQPIHRSSATDL